MVRVAVVGLGWWGRIIVGVAEASSKLVAAKGLDPSPAAADFAGRRGFRSPPTTKRCCATRRSTQSCCARRTRCTARRSSRRRTRASTSSARSRCRCRARKSLRAIEAVQGERRASSPSATRSASSRRSLELAPARGKRCARHAAADRGQFQPGQVPRAAARQLAPVGEGGAGGPAYRHRHPPGRPIGALHGPGGAPLREREAARQPARERRHARDPRAIQERRARLDQRHARHAVRRALRGVRHRRAGRRCATRRIRKRRRAGRSRSRSAAKTSARSTIRRRRRAREPRGVRRRDRRPCARIRCRTKR